MLKVTPLPIYFLIGITLQGTAKPLTNQSVANVQQEAILKAIKFILDNQKPNGLWSGQEEYHKQYKTFKMCQECYPNGWDTSATALCMLALLEHQDIEPDRQVIALEKGLKAMIGGISKSKETRPCTHQVIPWECNLWIASYALPTLVRASRHSLFKNRKEWINETINELIKMVKLQSDKSGGWSYAKKLYQGISFLSASNLLALLEAKKYGFEIPEECLTKTIEYIKSVRKGDSSFQYSKGAPGATATPQGSCARNPLCELALYEAGQGSQEKIEKSLQVFFKHRNELEKIRKNTTKGGGHEGSFMIAHYYFYFGHYYSALAAYKLKDKELMEKYISDIQEIFLELQEADGSFAGYDLFDRNYKAAYGILVLSMLKRKIV